MIKILKTPNDRTAACIFCDVCDNPIENASMAAVVFRIDIQRHGTGHCLHVHKGGCHTNAEELLGGRSVTGWNEMNEHLRQLVHNSKAELKPPFDEGWEL